MIALLSALLGFVSSAVPEFIRLFRDGKDRAHEITLLKLQMEYEQQKLVTQSAEQGQERATRLQAVALETQQAQELALNARLKAQFTGIHWVDALSGSVRPVLTYGFFLLYVAVKLAQFHLLVNPAFPWNAPLSLPQALVALWGEEDIAIFSAIMAFWFGSRIMQKRPIRS
jgi:hypothetical protein